MLKVFVAGGMSHDEGSAPPILHLKNTLPPSHWNVKHPSMKWFLEKAQQIIT